MVEVVCFGCGMSVGVEGLMGWEGGSTSVGVWHPGRLWAARGWRRLCVGVWGCRVLHWLVVFWASACEGGGSPLVWM